MSQFLFCLYLHLPILPLTIQGFPWLELLLISSAWIFLQFPLISDLLQLFSMQILQQQASSRLVEKPAVFSKIQHYEM